MAKKKLRKPNMLRKLLANKDLLIASRFTGTFSLLFAASFLLLSPLNLFNVLAAYTSQFVLGLFFGVSTVFISGSPYPILQTSNLLAEISDLCSMKIEIAVLFGIVFASFEKSLAYRLKGFAAGLALIFLFNPIRIAVTIYFYNVNNLAVSALFHDVLFRASIIFFIVTFYAIWYYWDRK